MSVTLRLPTLARVAPRVACPVAVVKADRSSTTPHSSPARVVVAASGKPGDEQALAVAFDLARRNDAGVLVVCPAGTEHQVQTKVRAVREDIAVESVERMSTAEPLAATLAGMSRCCVDLVADWSLIAATRLWRGRPGRRLLEDADCPTLITTRARRPAAGKVRARAMLRHRRPRSSRP